MLSVWRAAVTFASRASCPRAGLRSERAVPAALLGLQRRSAGPAVSNHVPSSAKWFAQPFGRLPVPGENCRANGDPEENHT